MYDDRQALYKEYPAENRDEQLFPDYYGGNLSAFWDCITDQLLSGLTYIEIFNLDKIKRFNNYDERLINILRECKHTYGNKYSENFFVTIVHEDGTREEIK